MKYNKKLIVNDKFSIVMMKHPIENIKYSILFEVQACLIVPINGVIDDVIYPLKEMNYYNLSDSKFLIYI